MSSRWEGEPTMWPELTQIGNKKHSFRCSIKRKPGQAIEFWQDNPTVANSGAKKFRIDEKYAEYWKQVQIPNSGLVINMPLVAAIESFRMHWPDIDQSQMTFMIGALMVDASLIEAIAFSDGFANGQKFCQYFQAIAKHKKTKTLVGQIVHWNRHTVYDPLMAKYYKKPNRRKFRKMKKA